VPRDSARFGLPGDRENIVKLNADHSTVCKFGSSQIDQDNLDLVQNNIQSLYKSAIKAGELVTPGSLASQGLESNLDESERALQARFDQLRGGQFQT
jgi:hypothetical protein